jgi:hypothetical protein
VLAFITSLRHPLNSTDYSRVDVLLEKTLRSVLAQTVDDFVVIVVGNQAPAFALPEKVHFVQVDFPPPPVTGNSPHTARAPFVWDKGTKIGVGLIAAKEFAPDHVMIFDADDFVHRDLASFTLTQPPGSGWVIEHGYMYSSLRNCYRPIEEFNRTCGTCHIVPFSSYNVPTELSVRATQADLALAYGVRLEAILGAHREALSWFSANGHELESLPFRGAVYHVDTGENHSGKSLIGIARPLTDGLAAEFGLDQRGTRRTNLMEAYGPRAISESLYKTARRLARWAVKNLLAKVRGRRTPVA